MSTPITSRTPKPIILGCMNESQGEIYWSSMDKRWKSLLVCHDFVQRPLLSDTKHMQKARNEYVCQRLRDEGYTVAQFKLQPKPSKDYISRKLAAAFRESSSRGFFVFTRDGDWMQDSVGETGEWLKIDGISVWHVENALVALENARKQAATTPPSSDPSLSSSNDQNLISQEKSDLKSEPRMMYDPVRETMITPWFLVLKKDVLCFAHYTHWNDYPAEKSTRVMFLSSLILHSSQFRLLGYKYASLGPWIWVFSTTTARVEKLPVLSANPAQYGHARLLKVVNWLDVSMARLIHISQSAWSSRL